MSPGLTVEKRQAALAVLGEMEPGRERDKQIARVAAACEEAEAVIRAEVEKLVSPDRDSHRLRTVRVSDVEPEAVEWLWGRRIPRGKLTLLVGDPSAGKSTITCAIAAAVTRGAPLPGDNGGAEPADVLMISAEDGIADTIRPRLDAAQADVQQVHVVECIEKPNGDPEHLTLKDPKHLAAIGVEIQARRPVLVVIDPLSAYLGDIDSYQDTKVRGVLAPLASLAERYGCAVVGIIHLTKSSGGVKTIYRPLGSIAFTAAARSILLAGSEPDQPAVRALVQVKSNLAPEAVAIGYRLVDRSGIGAIEWTGESELTAERMLAHGEGEQAGALESAENFLRAELGGGRVESKVVLRDAEAQGISTRTLDRAKQRLGVKGVREGFGAAGIWYWEPPTIGRQPAWQPMESQRLADYGKPSAGHGVTGNADTIERQPEGKALYGDSGGREEVL